MKAALHNRGNELTHVEELTITHLTRITEYPELLRDMSIERKDINKSPTYLTLIPKIILKTKGIKINAPHLLEYGWK